MKDNMKNKIKLLVSGIILSLSFSNVQAGILDFTHFVNKNPLLTAVGVVVVHCMLKVLCIKQEIYHIIYQK